MAEGINGEEEEEEIDGRREGIDGRSKGIGGSPCGRRNRRFALVCVFAYLCLCFGTYLVVFIFNNNNKRQRCFKSGLKLTQNRS
jgi:hypothetical protein